MTRKPDMSRTGLPEGRQPNAAWLPAVGLAAAAVAWTAPAAAQSPGNPFAGRQEPAVRFGCRCHRRFDAASPRDAVAVPADDGGVGRCRRSRVGTCGRRRRQAAGTAHGELLRRLLESAVRKLRRRCLSGRTDGHPDNHGHRHQRRGVGSGRRAGPAAAGRGDCHGNRHRLRDRRIDGGGHDGRGGIQAGVRAVRWSTANGPAPRRNRRPVATRSFHRKLKQWDARYVQRCTRLSGCIPGRFTPCRYARRPECRAGRTGYPR